MPRKLTNLDHAKRDDDLLSYLFIDLGLYQHKNEMSRKMQRDAFKVPDHDFDSALECLQRVKEGELKPREAIKLLRRQRSISNLFAQKREVHQRQHLESHLDRYLEMWLPDCGFEVFESHRYKPRKRDLRAAAARLQQMPSPSLTPQPTEVSVNSDTHAETSHQAASTTAAASSSHKLSGQGHDVAGPTLRPLDLGVRATRDYEVNQHIRLFGSAADITDEEDDELRMDPSELKADFSVLFSHTKNCFQLFMGPGRFVNHDCANNVELIRTGKSLCFKVVKPIKAGQEILTFYGAEYFGPNNDLCRCYTCRQACRGDYKHLAAKEGKLPVSPPKEGRSTRSGNNYTNSRETSEVPVGRRAAVEPAERRSGRSATKKASSLSKGKATRAANKMAANARRRADRKAAKAGKVLLKGKGKRAADSDDSSDEDYGASRVKRLRRQASPGALSPTPASDSDLTDLEDLDGEMDDLHGVSINEETGTAINPLNGETTDLRPTSANTTMLAASIPVLDEAAPSPLSGATPAVSNPASPVEQEASAYSSLSKGAALLIGKLSSVAVPSSFKPAMSVPLSPQTENSDTFSSSHPSMQEGIKNEDD